MRTQFTDAQLTDAGIKEANDILRTCVHCGLCTATCPTYLLLGDELDSPRGRIYLAKTMLESGKPATPAVVKHLDRCLTCLSCMTTCPSGVNYAHLVDQARIHIEKTYTRPLPERLLRRMLAIVVPNPTIFRWSLMVGRLGRPFQRFMPGRLRGMAAMAPAKVAKPSPVDKPRVFAAEGKKRMRVALLSGCAQTVLRPEINEATIRVLTRHGCEVVVAKGVGCCGALDHQMGHEKASRAAARANVAAWTRELRKRGLDAIVFNASGCGVSLKDYGHLLRSDPQWGRAAARISALGRDVSEILLELGLGDRKVPTGQVVTYHLACTMQHGLGLRTQSRQLLSEAGFEVREPAEAHICCGSAGVYGILQPELANQLRERKIGNLEAATPEIIASGNIGCITHISGGTGVPVVHTVELLDWATGGRKPPAIA